MQIPLRIINLGLARLWKLKATKSKNISSNTMNMSRFSLWSPGCWRKSSYTTRGGGAFSRCHQGVLGLGGGAVLNLGSFLDWLDSYFLDGWPIDWCGTLNSVLMCISTHPVLGDWTVLRDKPAEVDFDRGDVGKEKRTLGWSHAWSWGC